MGSLSNFLAARKTPGLDLDQLNLFEGKPVPTGLALRVPVDRLDEDPDNPRTAFPPEAIDELAQDIAQRGILQPIVVSDRDVQGRYLIRFGSRRWRAAIKAGLTEVPVIFAAQHRDAYDQVAENLKRQNLSPLELAQFIRRRVDVGESNAEIGRQLGMDLSTVAHHLALLSLPLVLEQALRIPAHALRTEPTA
jgi:ParB family transcriptional regulator, chromosome partitioning protein